MLRIPIPLSIRRKPPVRNHPPTHSLVSVPLRRMVAGHRHGALVTAVRDNSALGGCPRLVRIVGVVAGGIGGGLVRVGRRAIDRLPRVRDQRLGSIRVAVHRGHGRGSGVSRVKSRRGSWGVTPLRGRRSRLESLRRGPRHWGPPLLHVLGRGHLLAAGNRTGGRVVSTALLVRRGHTGDWRAVVELRRIRRRGHRMRPVLRGRHGRRRHGGRHRVRAAAAGGV